MANRKKLLTGSGQTNKQKPERDSRQELDFENLARTRERAGQ